MSRWLALTRHALPAMATEQRWATGQCWPIRHDHCFMRVCLDNAIGRRWDHVVRRPAIRHLTDDQLARAVAIAETLTRDPALLPALNASSLRMRGVR